MRKIRRVVYVFAVWGMIFTGCAAFESDRKFQRSVINILPESGKEEFCWPESGLASLLPEPEFHSGRVEWETEYSFAVSVGEIPEKEFNQYAAACYQKGFNINYQKGNAFFCADNKDGCHLILKSGKNNIMYVRLDRTEHYGRGGKIIVF